ncbi:MAG: hypothetical protein AAB074_00955 [Planctomycetota bacterium]
MLPRICRCLAVASLAVAAGCASREPQPGEPPFTPASASELQDIAGVYAYELDGTRRLEIGTGGGYEETIEGSCFETPPDEGDVGTDSGVIVLRPEKRPLERIRMVSVAWGERRYLLEERDVPEFCQRVKSGDEPRRGAKGLFYLREGDWNRSAAGEPGVPQEWRAFLSEEARLGKVTWVEGDGRAWTSLNAAEVAKGRKVYVECARGWEDAEVVDVTEKDSVVRLVVEGEEIRAGARVATVKPGE